MASIFMPRLREYSLAHLVATFGLQHANPHRALDDAEVTARVFHALVKSAMELDPGLLSELARLYARARGRLAPLLQRLEQARSRAAGAGCGGRGPAGAGQLRACRPAGDIRGGSYASIEEAPPYG